MEQKEASKKESFIYYIDWADELLKYPDELRLKIDDAVKRYVLYGEEPEDREVFYSIFGIIRKTIDRDTAKWVDIREKRRNAGLKGAEVTNSKTQQKAASYGKRQQMPTLDGKRQQKAASAAVYVNDNVNENIKENKQRKVGVLDYHTRQRLIKEHGEEEVNKMFPEPSND